MKQWSLPVLVVLMLLLASCGQAATPETITVVETVIVEKEVEGETITVVETVEVEKPTEKTKISYWYPAEPESSPDCVIPIYVDEFNAQSETVEVEVELNPENWEAVRTAMAAGSGPDVVTTPGTSFVFELANAGQLLPLNTFTKQMGWEDNIAPWALKLGVVDGDLYSLPVEQETIILFYNKTLFEEKGWEPPTTVDEMMALAQEISDEGIIPFTSANAEWRPMNEWFVTLFLNHVAGPDKVYQALQGEVPWTDPDFVEGIEMLNLIQQNGWFMGGLDRYYTGTFDEFRSTLASGEGAMNLEGTWFLAQIDEYFDASGNEWDWVPVPTASGEPSYALGMGSTYSINAASENPEAAAEFITHIFSSETQGRLLSECGFAPAPVKLNVDELQDIDPRVANIFASMNEATAAGNYGYTTWTFFPPKTDVYIYEDIELVWSGDITSEEYLAGMQEIFDEELAAGEIPPIPAR